MEKFISIHKMKKAQIWGLDLMVAAMLFLFGIFIFYLYSINKPTTKEDFEILFSEGEIITEDLLSEGYPDNWNSNDAEIIGITNKKKINETKLENFYNFVKADYAKTKSIFNTKYDYYFFLSENMSINGENIEGIGKPGATSTNINAKNLIKITRFTIYKEKPVTAYLYVWE